jgi:DNA-binding beta-propeller fold protein YncE
VSPDGRNVYVTSAVSDALTTFDRNLVTGALTQKFQTAGCVSELGEFMVCANGRALDFPVGVAVSPDGRNVYVASSVSDAVAVFDRDPATGALDQKEGTEGCVSDDGTGGDCANGVALDSPIDVAVSPDGGNVYVAAAGSDAVVVFNRNIGTGALMQRSLPEGCVGETNTAGCTDGEALDGPFSIVLAPGGHHLYVAAVASDAVAVFDRNVLGVLTQKAGTDGCVSDSGTAGECVELPILDGAQDVRLGRDGETLYVAATLDSALVVLDRDGATGALTPKTGAAGCVSASGSAGACIEGVALNEVFSVAESPDGANVYAAAIESDAVAIFDRSGRAYDVDGDGEIDALTDGLLLLRYAFGFRGAILIGGAVDVANCVRCTAEQIEAFIEEISG